MIERPNLIAPPESSKMPVRSSDIVPERQEDRESLRLIGTIRSEPLKDVKTILITGGAGFMLVHVLATFTTHYR